MAFYEIYSGNPDVAQELGGINHIVQDAEGFLWFGGETGLGRYDSQHTRIYRNEPGNDGSLPHNYIRGLLVDGTGVMWVATEAGLCSYQAQLDRFNCHPQFSNGGIPQIAVLALYTDANDNLYVGSRAGFYRISADRRHLRHYSLTQPGTLTQQGSGPVEGNTVMAVIEDVDGRLWLGTAANGLLRLDPDTGDLEQIKAKPDSPTGLAHNKIRSLALAADGRLWIATYGGGVSVLGTDRRTFTNFKNSNGEPHPLLSRVVWDIFRDSTDTLWLAVDQGGLARFEDDSGFTAQRHRPYDRTSLPSDQVRTIYEDRNGDLWIGTFPSGVSFYNRATSHIINYQHQPDRADSISHSAVLALHQDSRGQIWVGTEDGLNLLNPDKGNFQRFQYAKGTQLTAKAVLSIEQFDEDTLWIGTWSGGLLEFDLDSHQFRPIDTRPVNSPQQNSLFIWDILRDSAGNMWFATEFEGVGVYDRVSGQFQYLQNNPADPHSLAGTFIWALLEDRDRNIWIASNAGLNQWRRADGSLHRIAGEGTGSLTSHRLTSLFQDHDGDLWVGSQDNGVFMLPSGSQYFRHLGAAEGLPSLAVYGVTQDPQRQIWLLTTNGLVKLDKQDMQLNVFGARDGLAGNNFNRRATLLDPTGQLYAGGANGLSVFKPANLQQEKPQFPVWLTDLRILNRGVQIGAAGSPLKKSILFTDRIELDHRDLMFSLDFSALNYRLRHNTRYAYKLEGFDQNWNTIGQHNSATYTNLPPGDYVFRVRAFSGDNHWMQSPDLHIGVRPAPWFSRWAYATYAIGLLLAGYAFAHYFKLRVRSRIYQLLSTTDALTGVSNRLGLMQVVRDWFGAATRKQALCVLFIDIDHFKRINDRRGHASGDQVLREIAAVFRRCIRQADVLARWGGEEFILLCAGTDERGGKYLAEKIRREVADHTFDADHSPLKVTISIGVALTGEAESFDDTCKRADRALYEAKDQGRNCVVVAG